MKLEVQVRYMKPRRLSKEEQEEEDLRKEEEKTQRLIKGFTEEEEEERFSPFKTTKIPIEFIYKPYVLDTIDIFGFYPLDEEHTVLITDVHGEIPIRMAYEIWKPLFEYTTGTNIKTLKEFDFQKEETPKKRKER